jgi:transcriptional regulator with XRE-family HTH domain
MTTQAMKLLAPTLAELAKALKLKPDSVRSYRQGRRVPSPETARKVAELCAKRGKALCDLAEQLKGAAQ